MEDQAVVAIAQSAKLKRHGLTVRVAYTREDAVDSIQQESFDIVLLDLDLRGIDGTEVAKKILAHRSVPIVILTEHTEQEFVEKVRQITRYGYVLKSSGEFVLIESVRMALELFDAYRESKEKEQRYRALFYNTHTPMLLIRPESGEIVDANPAASSYYGWRHEELITKKIQDINQLSSEEVFQEMQAAEREQRDHFFFQHRLSDSSIRDVQVHSSPISVNGENLLYSIINDITEQKRMERELREKEEDLRITLHSIGDAVVSTDKKGRLTRMNPRAEQLTGYTFKRVEGRPLEEIFHIEHAETRETVPNPVERVLDTGTIVELSNHTLLISKEGKQFNISDSAAPIWDHHGTINGVVLTFHDVTEEYNKNLEIRERVKELECLYTLAEIVEKPGITIEEILQEAVNILPDSFLYPEICSSRIKVYNRTLLSNGYSSTKSATLMSPLYVFNEEAGFVEAAYHQEKPAVWEGPFLREERRLLDAVAERLGRITERMTIERDYEDLFDNMQEAVIRTNTEGYITMANPVAAELCGCETTDALIDSHMSELYVNPSFRSDVLHMLEEKKIVRNYEFDLLRQDGTIVHTLSTLRRLEDANGRFAGTEAMLRDISERKKYFDQLSMYKKAVDSSGDLVAAVDKRYRYIFANTTFCKYHRMNEDEIVGSHVAEVLGEELYSSSIKSNLDASINGEVVSFDMQLEYPEEGKKDINVAYYPLIVRGDIHGVVSVIRDISDRKKYEATLKENLWRKQWMSKIATQYLYEGNIIAVIKEIISGLSSNFPHLRVAYATIDQESTLTVQYAMQPSEMPDLTAIETDLSSASEYLSSLRNNKRTIVENVGDDERLTPLREAMEQGHTRAVCGIEVDQGAELTGLLFFDSPVPKKWDAHEVATLEEHADLLALMMRNERYQSKLEETNAVLQAALDQSQAGIVIADVPDGRIRYMNSAGMAICGEEEESFQEEVTSDQYAYRWKMEHVDGSPVSEEEIPLSRAVLYGESCNATFVLKGNQDRIIYANAAPIVDSANTMIGGIVVFLDVTESKQREIAIIEKQEQLEKALVEKETLLKEIHHRVKNNLNVVVSLLKLQKDEIETVEQAYEAFDESSKRIYSMALVHESLYRSERLSEVEMGHYIQTMIGQLEYSIAEEKNIEYEYDLDTIFVDITKAIPCGIIINEMVTNANKHAFSSKTKGRILVTLKERSDDQIELTVADNGEGLPKDFDLERIHTLGFNLIKILTQQIDGELTADCKNGTILTISFPA